MQISELMVATEAPQTAYLAIDTGTSVMKLTIAQLKTAIESANSGGE